MKAVVVCCVLRVKRLMTLFFRGEQNKMFRYIGIGFTVIIVSILLILNASPRKSDVVELVYVPNEVIDNIKIEIVEESILPEGISYSLKLKNESTEELIQNNVFVSLPIANEDRSKSMMNKCKIEATGNRLNILPGEEVVLNAFIQSENYIENKYLEVENPHIQIVGYINELKDTSQFEIYSSFTHFDEDFISKWENE